jgi:hypothetical protein
MDQHQSDALEAAQRIENAQLRARVIMLILAANIDGLRELLKEAAHDSSVSTNDYCATHAVYRPLEWRSYDS